MNHVELIKMIHDLDLQKYFSELDVYEECRLCPRNCGVNRLLGEEGYCRSDASFTISSICNHMGEEPPISGDKGICNIFFTNCNLQCVFCQNYQISRNTFDFSEYRMDFRRVLLSIAGILRSGMNIIGFVSPGHVIPQVKMIIRALRDLGLDPVFVYNSNGYDKVETLRSLEGM
ncbi:MAG: radical SAM protein, partial [Bacteroidetes bacterium]|nr:radical SAM protein [Bacteroidota bacterium]